MIKLSELKLNPDNPRKISKRGKISKRDYERLKKSIREFPQMLKLHPLVVDDKGVILGGNMRYKALRDLGYEEIPDNWVVSVGGFSEKEKRRFVFVDNDKFGEWDLNILMDEWNVDELCEWEINLPEIKDII